MVYVRTYSTLSKVALVTLRYTRQNFIALFGHSTFTVRSQKTIYSGYNWLSHHQQIRNACHTETVILNYIGGVSIGLSLSN